MSKSNKPKERTVTVKPGPGALSIEGGAVTVKISKVASSRGGQEILKKIGQIKIKDGVKAEPA